MDKVEFKVIDNDYQIVKSTDDKYILLSLFIGKFRESDNIQEIIDLLEDVKNENKTWNEAVEPYGMFLPIGYDSGHFKCNKDMAYFISDQQEYQNMEMPLQELIDLMKDWKVF